MSDMPQSATIKMRDDAPAAETPSAAIVRQAQQAETVTDSRGRVITFKKLSMLELMDVQEAAGAQLAANQSWMAMAMMAYSVTSIDGERVIRPQTKNQIRALVQRLGDEGMGALFAKLQVEGTEAGLIADMADPDRARP